MKWLGKNIAHAFYSFSPVIVLFIAYGYFLAAPLVAMGFSEYRNYAKKEVEKKKDKEEVTDSDLILSPFKPENFYSCIPESP